jgi:hypothetical protein
MPSSKNMNPAFAVTDCAMLSIATGLEAQNLRELRDRLGIIPVGSVYYHFWGAHLRPGFETPEYNNDFANWAYESLHDQALAERLGAIDFANYSDLERLREELIDVIEEHLYEVEYIPWAKTGAAFQFVRSILVTFDTGLRIEQPEQLVELLPHMTDSSLYYHCIDARRRPPEGVDDFRAWFMGMDGKYKDLIEAIADMDPHFMTLANLRRKLGQLFQTFLGGDR